MKETIKNLGKRFSQDFGLIPVISFEIEFYLMGPVAPDDFPERLQERLLAEKIPLYKVEKEKGPNQFEIALAHGPNIPGITESLVKAKTIIREYAEEIGSRASFAAKPYPNHPGSGLHMHLSLYDRQGKNVFAKHGDGETETMLHAIGGLLAALPESMIYFAPNPESYARFIAVYHPESETYDNAPTKITWGANNRTTAIRIPESTASPENRHIEHRVPGVDADPYQVTAAILAGVHYGLVNKINPGEKIYGNAYDAQYKLPELPGSLAEAEKLNREGEILSRYF